MKKICVLILILVLSVSSQAQKHAYLLHSDENINRLKDQIVKNEEVRNAWDEQLKTANQLLRLNDIRLIDCEMLGLAYRMTSEKRFAEAIKKVLLDYTSRDTWEGSDLLSRTPPWRGGLGTSHTSFAIAIGFDCAYDYLTPSERKKIADGIVRVGIKPAMDDWLSPEKDIHTLDNMGHNWWSACVYMAGFASMAIKDEVPEAKQWAVGIAQTATEWFNFYGSVLQNKPRTFDRDGGFYESINYAAYGISQYLLFRYAFTNALPDQKQPELPILGKISDFFINTTYYTKEGPLSVNFGDSNLHRNGNACVVLLWNLGFQKDRYAWYLNQVNHGTDQEGIEQNTPNGLILNPDLPTLSENYTPDLPDSHLYADMGWATLRDSWKDDVTMLAVKSGFTWNHTHADAGSFILFHKGKNLIIDSGNCSYGNPLYTKYFCQSEAHNVVLWDGKAQSPLDPYFGVVNPGSLHALIDGDGFKYLLADATGSTSRYFARNFRSFLWIGDVILVYDDLLSWEPGHFEWLLHYNGESKCNRLDLSIKQDNAEVLVRPLFPETFPAGGLPHDFPEKMRLEEKMGYVGHETDHQAPYWSISHFMDTDRTKFITAIILKNDQNKDHLPVIERLEGDNMEGVRITQKGKVTEVYFNMLADGQIKHRNSLNDFNGWKTDAYILGLTFDEGADRTKTENLKQVFVGHGSYLRHGGQPLLHALSKYTALVNGFDSKPSVLFDGQPDVRFGLFSDRKLNTVMVNGNRKEGEYNSENKLIELNLKTSK